MFQKVLVANRGEIARRIIRTCRRMGIRTVAVFSEADRDAPHVREADEAACIGPAAPEASYLSIPRLIEAAQLTGAEALHPGYGFLSERPELAEACAAAGIVFVGPSAAAMRQLGDKSAARRLAHRCHVPTVPGYDGETQDDATLEREAHALGFPLLIKAAAGGGGRGMRYVAGAHEFVAALHTARREAEQAFGDSRVLLERVVERARHVEVQLLGDRLGDVIALGDRDCSLQRRHQKLVEEAPAPDLDAKMRRAMHRAAERLAKSAGYQNAGTAEFLVSDAQFYFLELNARLQVEHTVTEMVTGVDLVESQLRIAAGASLRDALGGDHPIQRPRPLPSTPDQSNVQHPNSNVPDLRGHAIQARIYAEDPYRNFLPDAGTIKRLRLPAGPGVRVDAAYSAAGEHVSPEYDPLLAKVICWAPTRDEALARLDAALGDTVVLGVASNAGFLRRVLATPDFRRGAVFTGWLALHPELAAPGEPPVEVRAAAARAALRGPAPWRALAGWTNAGAARPVRFVVDGVGPLAVAAAGQSDGDPSLAVETVHASAPDGKQGWEIGFRGERWVFWLDVPHAPPVDPVPAAKEVAGARSRRRGQPAPIGTSPAPHGPGHWFVEAPLAGRAGPFGVAPGQEVTPGTPLVAIEAMKMQHVLAAARAARVVRLLAAPGAAVRAGQPLIELAPLTAATPEDAGDRVHRRDAEINAENRRERRASEDTASKEKRNPQDRMQETSL